MKMLKKSIKPVLASAIFLAMPISTPSVFAAAPNPNDVPSLSIPKSEFKDFNKVSAYAKKAVSRLALLGLFTGDNNFQPEKNTDRAFARKVLGTLDSLNDINTLISYGDTHTLVSRYFPTIENNTSVSVDGFLSKKGYDDNDIISREDFAYIVSQARETDIITNGTPIHNPAIANPGPLLGPTVYQSGSNQGAPVFDGSTVSIFHRAKKAINTTFNESPALTLQVHPEVFKSVSVGGIAVDTLQNLSAQLEVELTDGSIHRTALTSLTPFSIHGADGKAGVIRIEDGLLVLVDDLLGNVNQFKINGHTFTVDETIERLKQQSYQNGDSTNSLVIRAVESGLKDKGFSLQDRRLMVHNVILSKTALQQSRISPLSAPFNTIAGPSSQSRGFSEGYLYEVYERVLALHQLLNQDGEETLRESLKRQDIQETLLTGTKILTATTLLPHISELSNAPFLPNEALSSRVKKAGALLPSEPVAFQFDRLKRAAYIIMDDALSNGNASHLVTTGEITERGDTNASAFELRAGNFEATPLALKDSVLEDALVDYADAYEELVYLISGVEFTGTLSNLNSETFNAIDQAFSHPVLSDKMSDIKIGDLDFKIDMLATPSHVQDSFAPANNLTASRAAESFGLNNAQDVFPIRLAKYVCEGKIVSNNGDFIAKSKLEAEEQADLIKDFSGQSNACLSAVNNARYHQLLFVDNFQLPPFGPKATFISTQGIEIINRVLLTPEDTDLSIADIRLSYRLTDEAKNNAPTAVIVGPNQIKKGEAFVVNGNASSDEEGSTLTYQWRVVSGKAEITQSRSSSQATILPRSNGKLLIELQVNDGTANSKISRKTFNKAAGGSTGFIFMGLLSFIYLLRRKFFQK